MPSPSVAVMALVAGLIHVAWADVIFVYSVQRHGAREVLSKSDVAGEIHSFGGPTLLPQGERACYEAGVRFRQRYFNVSTCVASGTCMSYATTGARYGLSGTGEPGSFHNGNVLARSSSLDRTLLSAEAFLLGVFPPEGPAGPLPTGEQLVPVYSVSDADDYLIRGYTKCPAYQEALKGWFASDEFAAKEADTAAFRDSLGARLAGSMSTDLADFWNVYDRLSVWSSYGAGDPMPELDAAEMAEAAAIADWLETRKMAPEHAGRRLGGAMVGDAAARLQEAADAAASQAPSAVPRLATVSGHYPTILAVLAALGPTAFGGSSWGQRIPALSATLSFELHSDGTSPGTAFAVRLVGQDGPDGDFFTVPLPCASPGSGAEAFAGLGSCGLAEFLELSASAGVAGDAEWCSLCGNEAITPCRLQRLAALEAAAAVAPPSAPPVPAPVPCPVPEPSGACNVARPAAVAAVVAALITLLAATGGFAWFYQRQWSYWIGDKGGGARSAVVGNPAYGIQLAGGVDTT